MLVHRKNRKKPQLRTITGKTEIRSTKPLTFTELHTRLIEYYHRLVAAEKKDRKAWMFRMNIRKLSRMVNAHNVKMGIREWTNAHLGHILTKQDRFATVELMDSLCAVLGVSISDLLAWYEIDKSTSVKIRMGGLRSAVDRLFPTIRGATREPATSRLEGVAGTVDAELTALWEELGVGVGQQKEGVNRERKYGGIVRTVTIYQCSHDSAEFCSLFELERHAMEVHGERYEVIVGKLRSE